MFQHSIFRLCFYIVFSIWNNRTFSAICQSCLWEQLEVIMWRSIHHIKSITIHLIPIHLGSDCQKAALPTEIAHICWHFNLSESIPIHLKPPDFTSFHPHLSESISLRPQPPESISTYLNPDCQNAALQTEIAHAPTNPFASVTNHSRLLRWVKTILKKLPEKFRRYAPTKRFNLIDILHFSFYIWQLTFLVLFLVMQTKEQTMHQMALIAHPYTFKPAFLHTSTLA